MNTTGNSRPLALWMVISVICDRFVDVRRRLRDQRRMIQKIARGFAALDRFRRGVHQFVEVLEARLRFRRVLLLQHPPIARALFDELQRFIQRL